MLSTLWISLTCSYLCLVVCIFNPELPSTHFCISSPEFASDPFSSLLWTLLLKVQLNGLHQPNSLAFYSTDSAKGRHRQKSLRGGTNGRGYLSLTSMGLCLTDGRKFTTEASFLYVAPFQQFPHLLGSCNTAQSP